MNILYLYDEHFHVWIIKDYQSSILYSDGDETEQEEKSAMLRAKLFEQASVIEKLATELTGQQAQ